MDFTVENAGTTIACREYAGPDVSPDTPALVCVHVGVDKVLFCSLLFIDRTHHQQDTRLTLDL